MKITRYAIVFVLLLVTLLVPLSMRIFHFGKASDRKVMYNRILDEAMDTAVESIVVSANRDFVSVDKDACVSNYYKALYAGFTAVDSETTKNMLNIFTPVLAVMDVDGVYCYYSVRDSAGRIDKIWSEKTPYLYEGVVKRTAVDGGTPATYPYKVLFNMNGEMQIVVNGDVYEGTWEYLNKTYRELDGDEYLPIKKVLETDEFSSEGHYELVRDECITSVVMKQLNYYFNVHNEIAAAYNESYTFTIPTSTESDVSRSVHDVAFLSFFQGYPLGANTSDTYSNFEISGARVTKNAGYYAVSVEENGMNILYYHRPECYRVDGMSVLTASWYASKEEAAWAGAMPCPECKP